MNVHGQLDKINHVPEGRDLVLGAQCVQFADDRRKVGASRELYMIFWLV
jgi:hypothetical protein